MNTSTYFAMKVVIIYNKAQNIDNNNKETQNSHNNSESNSKTLELSRDNDVGGEVCRTYPHTYIPAKSIVVYSMCFCCCCCCCLESFIDFLLDFQLQIALLPSSRALSISQYICLSVRLSVHPRRYWVRLRFLSNISLLTDTNVVAVDFQLKLLLLFTARLLCICGSSLLDASW